MTTWTRLGGIWFKTPSNVFSTLKLTDLPDKVLLKVLGYLNTKDLIYASHVSKRLRVISHVQNSNLWEEVCIKNKKGVPTEFLEMVLFSGCKSLNLSLAG